MTPEKPGQFNEPSTPLGVAVEMERWVLDNGGDAECWDWIGAQAIRELIAERNALLDERQRFEARLFDMAETGDKARAERDALREALNRARRQSVAMLDYEHRAPDALAHQMYAQLHQIDAALEPRP